MLKVLREQLCIAEPYFPEHPEPGRRSMVSPRIAADVRIADVEAANIWAQQEHSSEMVFGSLHLEASGVHPRIDETQFFDLLAELSTLNVGQRILLILAFPAGNQVAVIVVPLQVPHAPRHLGLLEKGPEQLAGLHKAVVDIAVQIGFAEAVELATG